MKEEKVERRESLENGERGNEKKKRKTEGQEHYNINYIQFYF